MSCWGKEEQLLFRKPGDREDGGLVSQRTIFPELEYKLLLNKKGMGVKSWFQDVLTSSFLQPFPRETSQEVSYVLKKDASG